MQCAFSILQKDMGALYALFRKDRILKDCTKRTIESYDETVGKFAHWCTKLEIYPMNLSSADVREFMFELKDRGLGSWSRHKYGRGIKALLNFAHQEGILTTKIHVTLPKLPKKEPKYLKTDEAIQAVLAACLTIRDKLIVKLMLDSGLRRSELIDLRWEDLSWLAELRIGRMLVRRGKGRKMRNAYFTEDTQNVLEEYKSRVDHFPINRDEGYVFLTKDGTPLTAQGLAQVFVRLSERSGIKVSPHMLRHTYGRMSVTKLSLPALQKTMGHSSITTTMIYADLADEAVAEEYAKANNGK
jgi:site-specific recombinase XerD